MAKKFTEDQISVYRKCIRAGLSIEDIKNPDFNANQLQELYLAKKTGLDISLYCNPSISAETMREIRCTSAAGVDIKNLVNTVVKTGAYNDEQTKEIMDAARHGLNLKNMLNPELDALQMKQIKLGEREGLDTGVYAVSAFSAEQMQKLRFELLVRKTIENIKEFFSQAWNRFVDWVREEMPAERIQQLSNVEKTSSADRYISDSAAQFLSEKIYNEICTYFEAEHTEEAVSESSESVTEIISEKISSQIITGEIMSETEVWQRQNSYEEISEPPVIVVDTEIEDELAMEM